VPEGTNEDNLPVIEDDEDQGQDEPGSATPLLWGDSELILFKGEIIIEVNDQWIPKDDDYGTTYNFYGDSDLPYFYMWQDPGHGYLEPGADLRAFIDGYTEYYEPDKIIRKEFVSYNGIEGYEVEYENIRDGVVRYEHAFYAAPTNWLTVFMFRFPWDDAGMYADIPPYVFKSISLLAFEMNEWPAAQLPIGTPVYPGNDIRTDVGRDYSRLDNVFISVYINNTSPEVLLSYIESLSDSGWDITDRDSIDGGNYRGNKGGWHVTCKMIGENMTTASVRIEYDE